MRQFLSGDTEGPIGMSEEKDATKPSRHVRMPDESRGPERRRAAHGREAKPARSKSGMTAEETEEAERGRRSAGRHGRGRPQEENNQEAC